MRSLACIAPSAALAALLTAGCAQTTSAADLVREACGEFYAGDWTNATGSAVGAYDQDNAYSDFLAAMLYATSPPIGEYADVQGRLEAEAVIGRICSELN